MWISKVYCDNCCCCLVSQSGPTLCNPKPGLSVPHHLLIFAQVHVHCISDAIQPSHHLMPSSPSALNLSRRQGLFQWVNCSHQMTKVLEFQLPYQYSGPISFRIDWLDLLVVQGTLRSLLQHHSSKASIPRGSIFFTMQLSNYAWPLRRREPWLYRHQQSNVSVIAFLSRSKRLLISSLQSPSSVIL